MLAWGAALFGILSFTGPAAGGAGAGSATGLSSGIPALAGMRTAIVLQRLADRVPDSGVDLPLRIHRTPLQWSAEGGVAQARMGFAVSGADLDRDGYAEIMIGSPRWAASGGGEALSGSVIVFPGSAAGPQVDRRQMWRGDQPPMNLGRSLGVVRSLRGDGCATLLIGAPFGRAGFSREGVVYTAEFRADESVAFGNPGLSGKSPHGLFGSTVSAAGDLNGDGFQDVAIGAPRATYSQTREGGVFFYPGSPDGLNTRDPRWFWVGGQHEASCGRAIAAAGDVDRDGFDDVLVGMPGFDSDRPDAGRVCLVRGSASGPRLEPGWVAEGRESQAAFGSALAVGDLNGDGFPEVLIGAPGQEGHAGVVGRVWIFRGVEGGFSREPAQVLTDGQPGARFGAAVSIVADLNGDGRSEVLVGSPRFDGEFLDEGRVALYLGSAGVPNRLPDWILLGGRSGSGCGHAVAGVGDVNGDRLGDFLVGSPEFGGRSRGEGRVDLFFGATQGYALGEAFQVDGTNAGRRELPFNDGGLADLTTPAKAEAGSGLGLGSGAAEGGRLWVTWLVLGVSTGLGFVWIRRHRFRRIRAERERIARDLHDEVGIHLARLSRLRGEGGEGGEGSPEAPSAKVVAEAAEAMARALERAVWELNPRHDNLESLVTFIGTQAERAFEGTPVRCYFDFPESLPDRELSPAVRKNLLLCVREALANVLEHARATAVHLRIRWEDPRLAIQIRDDGRGFRAGAGSATGNGLRNLDERMQSIGGRCEIRCPEAGGTLVSLELGLER